LEILDGCPNYVYDKVLSHIESNLGSVYTLGVKLYRREPLLSRLSKNFPIPHQGGEIIAIGPLENGAFCTVLVKISINFSPSYSTVFFSITVYISTVQKFQNFSTKISKFKYNVLTNKKIAYSMRVVHSTVGTVVHWLHYILIKAWSCTISSGVVYWLSRLCSVFQCYSYITHYICTTHQLDCWLGC
jgi:hypothetical protein